MLLDRTLCSLTPQQATALLADQENSGAAAQDQTSIERSSPRRSPGMRPPEPLGPQHQLEGFDCGNAALNSWLQQRALANERHGVSGTVVLCPDECNDVIDYACLSAGAIVLAGRCSVPCDGTCPISFLLWCWAAWRWIDARAWLAQAIDEEAAAFYRLLGCRPSLISASTLRLQLS